MKIIPAIDLIDGQCVRLTRGDYATKKVYNSDPVEVAKQFEGSGIKYLHLVDLDGAKAQHIVNYKVLEEISHETKLHIDFGGGLKTDEDLRIAFESGADQVTGGSIAVKDPPKFENWLSKYGAERIILGADCIRRKIAVHGWQEESDMEVVSFIDAYVQKGVRNVVCTDISKDGMLQGPSFELYTEILNKTPLINLIASGGVSRYEELPKLADLGCSAVIIGKAIYEGKITLKQLESFQ